MGSFVCDESLLSLISRFSEFQQFDYNVPQCGSSRLFCLKFIYVLGCLHSYLASNLGCFPALNFSSDIFSLQQLYFSAPKFFKKIFTIKKNKAKQLAISLLFHFVEAALKNFFGSFVYQFKHLFQTDLFLVTMGSTGGTDSKESTCNAGEPGFDPWVGKIPWRRAWQPSPVFLPGESPWTEEPGRLQSMGFQRVGHE